MSAPPSSAHLEVEPGGESSGHCDCCGRESHSVWGWIHGPDATVAAYFVHWTVGHLEETGANIDFIIGSWGDDAFSAGRVLVSLLYRMPEDTPPAVMVIDAGERLAAKSELAGSALRRSDVIGTPLAAQVFDLIDAIFIQDERFF